MPGRLFSNNFCLGMLTFASVAIGQLQSVALSQPVGDGSLNSQVNVSGNVFQITGGQQAGPNLFHSFQAFNIPAGGTAQFLPSPTVEAIFSRITDTVPSKIGGRIAVLGNADLFLLNPNGFVFEAGARLSLNGDFTLTTADSVGFASGDRFFVSPTQPTLLSISSPVGLGNISAASHIENRSNLTNTGGEIAISAGQISGAGDLRSSNGSIQLTSEGQIQQNRLIAPGISVEAKGDVSLLNLSATESIGLSAGGNLQVAQGIKTLGEGGDAGSVALKAAGDVSVGGTIDSRSTAPVGNAGAVSIKAEGNLHLTEIQAFVGPETLGDSGDVTLVSGGRLTVTDGAISTFNGARGMGNSGDIRLEARDILLTGTRLQASNLGEGRGGDIQLQAQNSIQLRSSATNESRILTQSDDRSQGDAGNILLQAGEIDLVDTLLDAQMKGVGRGGDITLLARNPLPPGQSNRIQLAGDRARSELVTRLAGRGRAGNIILSSQNLSLENNARLRTVTDGEGDAGSVSIEASDLRLADNSTIETGNTRITARGDGGQLAIQTERLTLATGLLLSEVQGQGDAGDIVIEAKDSVTIEGDKVSGVASLLRASVAASGQGQAGRIAIATGDLTLSNQVQVQANAENAGAFPGQIDITAENVLLENGVRLSTDVKNSANGDGGPISIAAGRIIATDNSDITAQPRGGGFGVISLKAKTINGLQPSDRLTPGNDLVGIVAIEILPDSPTLPVDLPEPPIGEPNDPQLPEPPTDPPIDPQLPEPPSGPLPESSPPAGPTSEPGSQAPLPGPSSSWPTAKPEPQRPKSARGRPVVISPGPGSGPGSGPAAVPKLISREILAPAIAIVRPQSPSAQDESTQDLQFQVEAVIRAEAGLAVPQFLGCRDSDATLRLAGRGGLSDSARQVLPGRSLWVDSRAVGLEELAHNLSVGHGEEARLARQTMPMLQEATAWRWNGDHQLELLREQDLSSEPDHCAELPS